MQSAQAGACCAGKSSVRFVRSSPPVLSQYISPPELEAELAAAETLLSRGMSYNWACMGFAGFLVGMVISVVMGTSGAFPIPGFAVCGLSMLFLITCACRSGAKYQANIVELENLLLSNHRYANLSWMLGFDEVITRRMRSDSDPVGGRYHKTQRPKIVLHVRKKKKKKKFPVRALRQDPTQRPKIVITGPPAQQQQQPPQYSQQ